METIPSEPSTCSIELQLQLRLPRVYHREYNRIRYEQGAPVPGERVYNDRMGRSGRSRPYHTLPL